ncbi:MAG: type II toxin-antitoxin system HicB family antitoxin [Bacteroidia bacterium]|nr:type II toxin-antitoxin system HicB family antitoxin [Bacteroidia bacterium]
MKRTILFRIYKGEKYYIAEGVDVPVVTQGKTLDQLISNLKEAIELHFEDKDFYI